MNYDDYNVDINIEISEAIREEDKKEKKKKRTILIIIIIIIIILLLLLTFFGMSKLIDNYNKGKAIRNDVIDYYEETVYKSINGTEVKWYCSYNKRTGNYETYINDNEDEEFYQIYPASGIWDCTNNVKNPTTEIYYIDSGDMIGQYIAVIENNSFDDKDIIYQRVIYNNNIVVTVGVLKDKSAIVYQNVEVTGMDFIDSIDNT